MSKERESYSSTLNDKASNNNQNSENNYGDEYEDLKHCDENFSEEFYDSYLDESINK